jgi:hypothetical protein
MPRQAIVYSGWVGAREIDRVELETMGVEIFGDWNPACTFDHVRMTTDVYKIFCKRWKGRYVWGLIGRVQEIYTKEEMDDVPF